MRPTPSAPRPFPRRASCAPAAFALLALAVGTTVAPRAAAAQGGRWQEIGRTNIGNPVLLDRRSVRRVKDVVTATLRVRFAKPVASPRGPLTSTRTVVTFDCARRLVAVRENTIYHDEAAERVYEHRVVGAPGFAPPMGGSMPEVAIAHLCQPDASP